VSVVIPSHDRASIIGPTLDSVLAQAYDSFEVIVVDDASTDGLGRFLAERFPTVRVVRLDVNVGVAAARNRGVAAARGELIAFCDNDDLWSPDKLRLQVQDFDEHPEAVLSFTDITTARAGTGSVYSRTQPFEPGRVLEQLTEGGPILPSAVLLRKRDFDAVGGFDPACLTAEDRDLWLRLAVRGPIRFLPASLVRRVVYDDSLSHRAELWEAAYSRVLTRFLARPEGEPFRPRARALLAFQYWKIGARLASQGAWSPGASLGGRALRLDPLVALRRPGRRLLRDVIRNAEGRGFARLEARLGGAAATRRLRQLHSIVGRATDALLGYRPGAPWPPPPGLSFRPPPPAPDGPRSPS
jgi:glycosyltransferase involved in cell wall biosynthesis